MNHEGWPLPTVRFRTGLRSSLAWQGSGVCSGFMTDFAAQYKHFAGAILAWTVFVAVKTDEAYCRVSPLAPFANVYPGQCRAALGIARLSAGVLQNVNRFVRTDRHAKYRLLSTWKGKVRHLVTFQRLGVFLNPYGHWTVYTTIEILEIWMSFSKFNEALIQLNMNTNIRPDFHLELIALQNLVTPLEKLFNWPCHKTAVMHMCSSFSPPGLPAEGLR